LYGWLQSNFPDEYGLIAAFLDKGFSLPVQKALLGLLLYAEKNNKSVSLILEALEREYESVWKHQSPSQMGDLLCGETETNCNSYVRIFEYLGLAVPEYYRTGKIPDKPIIVTTMDLTFGFGAAVGKGRMRRVNHGVYPLSFGRCKLDGVRLGYPMTLKSSSDRTLLTTSEVIFIE